MNHKTAEQLIAFESRIKARFEAGELPFLLHLCGGNEAQLIDIFRKVKEGDWIFSTHRNHYHYLLAGGDEAKLEQMICEGRSMFVYDRKLNFCVSAVLAGMCCVAAGVALALKQSGSMARVWCFLGDGAEDNGHFAEAVRYATGHDLPVTFVIEDNDRQVDTTYAQRWGTKVHRWHWNDTWDTQKVRRYHYQPTYPHAGRGAGPMVTFKPEIVAKHAQS